MPPPGVGKSHLAFSLATAAAESGRCVYFGTLVGLIESLERGKAAGQLSRRLRVLTHPALLVVNEIGYPPVTRNGAVLFDRMLHDCHIVNIRGNSYGMREHQEMWPSMHAPEA